MSPPLDPATVLAMLQAQGHDWADEEVARRIAAAAGVAIAAVEAVQGRAGEEALPGASAAEFAAALERLAEAAK
ncbi:MAG TPA: hypothetical protein VMT50_06395 [Steroidobacteraceae bacterium]|nr:hypothetical protein [Steroidobacteraceae bacterium]